MIHKSIELEESGVIDSNGDSAGLRLIDDVDTAASPEGNTLGIEPFGDRERRIRSNDGLRSDSR